MKQSIIGALTKYQMLMNGISHSSLKLKSIILKPIIMLVYLSSFYFPVQATEVLTLGVLGVDSNQRYSYDWITRKFEKHHPNVKIKTIAYSDEQFKQKIEGWFANKAGPDVITWQGGERLYQFIRRGLIKPIDTFWQVNALDDEFDLKAINAVSLNNSKYGLPISYYNWGFYYRKSVFLDLKLHPPKTWQELLDICETLQNAGILPITIGTKNPWTASAWFSYITMRLYGIEYYYALIQGETSYIDPKAKKIFEMWKVMLDANYFLRDHQQYDWNEIMPSLFRNISGMTLIGNFFIADIPDALIDDFGYFNFPKMDPEVPRFELAPLDLLMIPSYSKNTKLAEKFLLFMSNQDVQSDLNEKFQMLPTNINAHIQGDYFTKVALTSLLSSKGNSQFFDRDTTAKTYNAVLPLFVEFMNHKDVTKITTKLEQLRLEGVFDHK
ncbi:MAG: multiple sugar transport system substrate-binding protein [Flavobacteriales bacterium]|jgi:multiple sugar transport system substrate-binding protein